MVRCGVVARRIDRILDHLTQAAEGRRALPVVTQRDAEAVCALFHEQVDRGTARRAEVVAAAGRTIACGAGCDACCANVAAVFAGEAVAIAGWLRRPDHAAIRAGFEARFGAWRAGLGDLVDRWAAASRDGDVEAGKQIAAEAWERQVKCAFLDDGRCSIYPVRPTICRDYHALDTADGCQPGKPVGVAQASFPPLEGYLDKIRPVVLAMHAALRPDEPGALPLCQAVHDELSRDQAGST